MSLFRRFRKEKEDEPEAQPPDPAESTTPVKEPVREIPASPAAASPAPTDPGPARVPPPLPDRPTGPPATASPGPDPFSKCFVCGTPLVDHNCPTCRMTWVE